MKTEGLSRQEKRKQTRDAAKTIGKLNHILKNPAQTVGAAKMQNKNINQYVTDLQRMGVIKPPSLFKRAQRAFKEVPRFFRRLWKTFKYHTNMGDVF